MSLSILDHHQQREFDKRLAMQAGYEVLFYALALRWSALKCASQQVNQLGKNMRSLVQLLKVRSVRDGGVLSHKIWPFPFAWQDARLLGDCSCQSIILWLCSFFRFWSWRTSQPFWIRSLLCMLSAHC